MRDRLQNIREALYRLEDWISWAASNKAATKGAIQQQTMILKKARAELAAAELAEIEKSHA